MYKTPKVALLLLISSTLYLTGCVPAPTDSKSTVSFSKKGGRGIASTSGLSGVKHIVKIKCLGCHGPASPNGDFSILEEEKDFLENGLVVAKNLNLSPLYNRLAGVGIGISVENMPVGSHLQVSEIKTIRNWILQIDTGLPPAEPTDFEKVTKIIKDNCISCHAVGSTNGDFESLTTEELFQKSGYVTAKDNALSPILYRLKGAALGIGSENMPPVGNISTEDINQIKSWIAGLDPLPVVIPKTGTAFEKVTAVIAENCISCHGDSSINGDFNALNTEALFIASGYVKPGSLSESPFAFRLRGSVIGAGVESMPPGKTISDEDMAIVKDWVTNLEDVAMGGGSVEPPIAYEDIIAIDSSYKKPRLGDRFYVTNVFNNVFGPHNINFGKDIANYIYKKQSVLGGSCSTYEVNLSPGKAKEFPDLFCVAGAGQSITPQIVQNTVIRDGYKTYICDRAYGAYNSTAFMNAFAKAGVDRNAATFNTENMQKVYNLFFPDQEIPADTVTSILSTKPSFGGDTKKLWDGILLSFCLDPTWQIP